MSSASSRRLTLPDDRTPPPSSLPIATLKDFYREELIKHRQCLRAQREHFSPRAIAQVEQAISRTLAQLDQLCTHCDCDRILSCLLRKLDQVTNLSAWSDPRTHH
ncbi:MAG TPA: hypothetical protein VIL35_13595 [Vicinamibacterales bacterium]